MQESKQNWVVIPATGTGQRMLADRPKQYLQLQNKTVLEHTLDNLLSHTGICGAVLILNEADEYWSSLAYQHDKPVLICTGGKERLNSVFNGLTFLREHVEGNPFVLIHDAVRPFVSHQDLDNLLKAVRDNPHGALLAVPVNDTLKLADDDQCVKTTHPRDRLWRAMTPQVFKLDIILQALATVVKNRMPITDDAGAMELMGLHPKLVAANELNIKITRPEDMQLALIILRSSEKSSTDLC
jgi:2-C-methyl-D-erythritol 4-phosphate cytidylyltransferase